MLDDALRALKRDRRLLERRGWVTRSEVEQLFASLPDAADKAAPPETAPESPEGSGESR